MIFGSDNQGGWNKMEEEKFKGCQIECYRCNSRKMTLLYVDEEDSYILHLACQTCGAVQVYDLEKNLSIVLGDSKKPSKSVS